MLIRVDFLAWPIAKDKTNLNLLGFFKIGGDIFIGFFLYYYLFLILSGGMLNCSR